MQPSAEGKRRSTWLVTALACAAMLLLPTLVWLLAPRPTAPPRPARRATPSAPATVVEARLPPPRGTEEPAATTAPAADVEQPVTGRVLDPQGNAVAGAFVSCDDGRAVPATSTDDRGRFQLPAEASGCLAVTTHPSFVASKPVKIIAGRDNVLTLEASGAIEGDVVDDRGQPVTAYQLGMESYQGAGSDPPTGQTRAIQDARGAFRWENLAPGTYVLSAGAEGRPFARSRPIEVELGRTTHHVRIALPRSATLSGRVFDADTRQPLAGATVAFDALTSSGIGSGFATADESGAYALSGAPPGPFSVRVAREGYVSKIVPGLVTRGADAIRQDVELRRFVEGGPRDELAGIGAVLAPTPKGVLIGPLVAGGPAESAGLLRGDRIRRIDGEDASAMTLSDCVQRLRGANGTIVSVQVEREGKTIEVNIVRRPVAR
ncbi:Hypothetical protein A7982_08966 [Minicystis rosea]|nr:Hypothetical protein A7982_08966 [Minicystis rosea]